MSYRRTFTRIEQTYQQNDNNDLNSILSNLESLLSINSNSNSNSFLETNSNGNRNSNSFLETNSNGNRNSNSNSNSNNFLETNSNGNNQFFANYLNNDTNNNSATTCNITYHVGSIKTLIRNNYNNGKDIEILNEILNETYYNEKIQQLMNFYTNNFSKIRNKKTLWDNVKTIMNRLNTEYYNNNNYLPQGYFCRNMAICKTKILNGISD
jgi:hypothetical protein